MNNKYISYFPLLQKKEFFEKVCKKVLNNEELNEKEIYKAKQYYEEEMTSSSYEIRIINATNNSLGRKRLSDKKNLDYEQFKVYEYLELYGHVEVYKEKKKEITFDNTLIPLPTVIACLGLSTFLAFLAGILFAISIVPTSKKHQTEPSRIEIVK